MNTQKLSNISLKQFMLFLKNAGCEYVRTSGGHEIWDKSDKSLTRPIIIQTHFNRVSQMCVYSALRTLGLSRNDFFELLNKK